MMNATAGPTHALPRAWPHWMEWPALIVVALLIALGLKAYLVQAYVIPSPSMFSTIMVHNHVLVDRSSFDFGHLPRRGQIIVFHEAAADPDRATPILIKRVIGLPGESLRSGPHGSIFVDNRLISQPWLTAAAERSPGPNICSALNTTDCHDGVLHLPANEYYMMGDNRGDSADSRYWGPISGTHFTGRTFALVWPLGRVHWF